MFLRLHALFLGVVWFFERVSPDAFSQDSLSKVQCRNESIGRHPVPRVVQRTLGKSSFLSVGVDSLFRVLPARLEFWHSRGMYLGLSRGMNVNE